MPAQQLLPSAHVNAPKSGSLAIQQGDIAALVHKAIVLLMLGSYGDLREPRGEANLDEPLIWLDGEMHVSNTAEVTGWLLILISPGHEIQQNCVCWTI